MCTRVVKGMLNISPSVYIQTKKPTVDLNDFIYKYEYIYIYIYIY